MKGQIFKDASGLLEVLDKGMKPEQGFQACPFPDFTVWQSVFTKGTPSVSDLSRLCFSSHERRASGRPPPDLCRLRPCHCSPLSPQFCPHILDIPCVLTPALAEVPALTAFVPPRLPTWPFPSRFGGLFHQRHGPTSILVKAAAPPRDAPAPAGEARRQG